MKVNKQRRWLMTLLIIGVVVLASLALILTNRASSERIVIKAVGDASGNAFVAWYQGQSIHIGKMEPSGNLRWSKELALENTQLTQPDHFTLAEDGQCGVIVTWGSMFDTASFNSVPIRSLRLNAEGQTLWENGVFIGSGEHHGFALNFPQPMPDGTGGAYVLWNDFKPAFKALHDDYFKLAKLSPEGKQLWEKLLFSSPPFHPTTSEDTAQGEKGAFTRSWPLWTGMDMVSDGHGGTIVIWKEETQHRYASILGQRYNTEGQPVWPDGGILISSGWDTSIQLKADNDGGAIIIIGAGNEQPGGSPIYTLQRVTGEGKLLWPDAGVLFKDNLRPWGNIEVIPQDKDIILVWQETIGRPEIIDGRPVQQIAFNAQRISAEGNTVWERVPVFTSRAGESFSDLEIVSDNKGIWLAWRTGVRERWGGKIFAQKINTTDGSLTWGEGGLSVLGNEFQYQGPPVIISDSSGGAIILTAAGRSPAAGDMVYAQRLDASGHLLWGEGLRVSR